jgi:dolichol kinase
MIPETEKSSVSIKLEMKRKAIHLGMLIIPLWIYFVPNPIRNIGLIIATFSTIVLDILRLSDPRLKKFFLRFFRSLIRRHEERHLLGSTYFMVASLISSLIFDETIAISALLFLVIGDMAAAVVGKKFGRSRYWGKSIEGSTACLASCLLIGFAMQALLDADGLAMVFGAIVATIAEAVPAPMDDNMRVPILSGIVMQIVVNLT